MNASLCYKCCTVIQSKSVHDFVECRCRDIFVDGGQEYRRFGWMPNAEWEDLLTQEQLEEATKSLEDLK